MTSLYSIFALIENRSTFMRLPSWAIDRRPYIFVLFLGPGLFNILLLSRGLRPTYLTGPAQVRSRRTNRGGKRRSNSWASLSWSCWRLGGDAPYKSSFARLFSSTSLRFLPLGLFLDLPASTSSPVSGLSFRRLWLPLPLALLGPWRLLAPPCRICLWIGQYWYSVFS